MYKVCDSAQLVCNRQLTLDCYYGFYNFRLSHVIDRKYVHRNSPTFKESQLWYIANSILSIIKELQQQKLPLGGFTSKDFFLTPEGELKYYPNQLRKGISREMQITPMLGSLGPSRIPGQSMTIIWRQNSCWP